MAKRKAKAKAKVKAKAKLRPKKAAAPSTKKGASAAKKAVSPLAAGMQWVNPDLCVKDPVGALAFYENAFGFTTRFKATKPDGSIGHAELQHHDSVIMLGPECPEDQSKAPSSLNGTPVTLYVYVEDVDAALGRAKDAGGIVAVPATDMFWGDRMGVVVDPEGHKWCLATHVRDVSPEEMERASEEAHRKQQAEQAQVAPTA
jgi:PhnB protein